MTTGNTSQAAGRVGSSNQLDWTDFDSLLEEFKMPEPGVRRPTASVASDDRAGEPAEPETAAEEAVGIENRLDFETAFAEEMLGENGGKFPLALSGAGVHQDHDPDGDATLGGKRRFDRALLARLGKMRVRFPVSAGQYRLVGGAAVVLLLLAGANFGVGYPTPLSEPDDTARQAQIDGREGAKGSALAGVFDSPTYFAEREPDVETPEPLAARVVKTEKISARIASDAPVEGVATSAAPRPAAQDERNLDADSPVDVPAAEMPLTAAPKTAGQNGTGTVSPEPDEQASEPANTRLAKAEPVVPAPAPRPDAAEPRAGGDALPEPSDRTVADIAAAAEKAENDRLLEQGRTLMESGNIASARLIFERVVEAGDPRGARAMGMTFDPDVYARLPVLGLATDEEKARLWYAKATDMAGQPGAAAAGGN